jgi:hypothetical protein
LLHGVPCRHVGSVDINLTRSSNGLAISAAKAAADPGEPGAGEHQVRTVLRQSRRLASLALQNAAVLRGQPKKRGADLEHGGGVSEAEG